MATEARVNKQLLAVIGFMELDEEDSLFERQLAVVAAAWRIHTDDKS
jgi:hypothetical protein